MPTPCWLKHLCSIRALVPVSLSLSLFLRLIPWSAEALWVHFPAWASKTLLRRCSAPSPHREGAWGLREQSKPCTGALLAFCVNQGISASFSPLLSYRQLRTTKFWSIKGPQQQKTTYCLIPFMWNIQNRQIHGARKKWFPGFDERGEQGITAYVTRVSI